MAFASWTDLAICELKTTSSPNSAQPNVDFKVLKVTFLIVLYEVLLNGTFSDF